MRSACRCRKDPLGRALMRGEQKEFLENEMSTNNPLIDTADFDRYDALLAG